MLARDHAKSAAIHGSNTIKTQVPFLVTGSCSPYFAETDPDEVWRHLVVVSEHLQQFADVKVLRRLLIPAQEREEKAEMEVVHERVYTDEVLVAGTLHREEAVHLQVKYIILHYTTGYHSTLQEKFHRK